MKAEYIKVFAVVMLINSSVNNKYDEITLSGVTLSEGFEVFFTACYAYCGENLCFVILN